jgi:hypothetical protein
MIKDCRREQIRAVSAERRRTDVRKRAKYFRAGALSIRPVVLSRGPPIMGIESSGIVAGVRGW